MTTQSSYSLEQVIEAFIRCKPYIQQMANDTASAIRRATSSKTLKVSEDSLNKLTEKQQALNAFLEAISSIEESPNHIPRDELLHGHTYKIKPAHIEEAVYITINNKKVGSTVRPVEIFINSKNMESFQWVNALTRLLSAAMQQPGPFPLYLIEELKQTHDPQGGYFVKQGRVSSIVAHIGTVLEEHCKGLGIIDSKPYTTPTTPAIPED